MKRSNETFDKTQSKYWNQNRLWPLSLPICEEILSEKCDSGDKMGVLLVVSFYCVYIKCLLYGWVYICFQLQIKPLLLRWNSIAHGEIHISKRPVSPYPASFLARQTIFLISQVQWLSGNWVINEIPPCPQPPAHSLPRSSLSASANLHGNHPCSLQEVFRFDFSTPDSLFSNCSFSHNWYSCTI